MSSPIAPKVRVGLVGAGYVAAHHLRALNALSFVEVVGVCDRDRSRAEALAKKFRAGAVYTDMASMAGAKPDVIHILTPPAFHCSLALAAMDLGCHVFVEKPMAESVEECDRMIAHAREKGVVLSVNHSDRFDPVVLQAIAVARSGAIGEVLGTRSATRLSHLRGQAAPSRPPRVVSVSRPRRATCTGRELRGPVQNLEVKFYESAGHADLRQWRAYAECEPAPAPYQNTRRSERIEIHGTRGIIKVDRFRKCAT
jgi:predicted dehydrogenase